MVDHYINIHPPNWNVWTQQKIEESQYVLLVCSPTLAQALRNPAECILDMEKGKYYVSSIVNYVQPQKFIPVFISHYVPQYYLEWVPKQLHASAVYSLNISEFRMVLMVPEDTPRHVLDEKLRHALSEHRFKEIAKLVSHLRDESATSPPVPPPHPIEVHPMSYVHGTAAAPQAPRPGLHEHIPDSALETIAERMPRDWFTLGVKLGVPSSQLEKLRSKHSSNHVPAALDMFSLWQQAKGRSATRRALKDILVKMEYGRLAKELFPKD